MGEWGCTSDEEKVRGIQIRNQLYKNAQFLYNSSCCKGGGDEMLSIPIIILNYITDTCIRGAAVLVGACLLDIHIKTYSY